MPNFWDSSGYDPSWSDSGFGGNSAGRGMPEYGADMPSGMNPSGAGSDPFDYTDGSLLTPWRRTFDGSKFGGGGPGVPEFKPFEYGEFEYAAARPRDFGEVYNNPGDFTYGEYSSRGQYQAPTEKDLRADPSYKFRMEAGQKALTASKAAQGVLKTGGAAKALLKYGQDAASQEYAAVDARKRRDYEGDVAEDRFRYDTNRANVAENFDRNVSNARSGFQLRQGAWKDNAAVAIDASRHGYDVAQGVYDRGFSKARSAYEDERSHANAVAAAGAAGASRDYNRALDEYKMARDEFWTNQDRQYAILDREDMKGRDAAFGYADRAYRYAGDSGELALQRGNAQASGRVGAANAWTNAAGNIGQGAADLMLYASRRGAPPAAPLPSRRVAWG